SGTLLQTLHSPSPRAEGQFGTSMVASDRHLLVEALNSTLTTNSYNAFLLDASDGSLLHDFTLASGAQKLGAIAALSDTYAFVSGTEQTANVTTQVIHVFDLLSGNHVNVVRKPSEFATFGTALVTRGEELVAQAFSQPDQFHGEVLNLIYKLAAVSAFT